MHAYMHTCIHAYMHTCMHTYRHACAHAYTHRKSWAVPATTAHDEIIQADEEQGQMVIVKLQENGAYQIDDATLLLLRGTQRVRPLSIM